MAGRTAGKDRDADHELPDPWKTELYRTLQILRQAAAAGLTVPGVRRLLWEALRRFLFCTVNWAERQKKLQIVFRKRQEEINLIQVIIQIKLYYK